MIGPYFVDERREGTWRFRAKCSHIQSARAAGWEVLEEGPEAVRIRDAEGLICGTVNRFPPPARNPE